MKDPTAKRRPWKEYVKPTYTKRNDLTNDKPNHKFYNSRTWRAFRKAIITKIGNKQYNEIGSSNLDTEKKLYLLDNVPVCKKCYEMYINDWRDTVRVGTDLDHIQPVNPENALNTEDGKWGNPLDEGNVQLLCKKHHTIKTQRDKKTTHETQ
jgi:hypothetical protein